MKKYKLWVINATLILMSLLLCIIVTEYFSSLMYTKKVPEKNKMVLDVLINGKPSESTGRFEKEGTAISEIEILPYYFYRNKPYSKIEGVQQVNKEGSRNGEKEFSIKEKNKIRIIAIGGSTTYGWLIKDYKETWPLQLESILNKKFNGKIEVINAGLPGGTSAESLVAFILKDKYLNPDIVIFHNGGNDAPPLFYKDYSPDYRHYKNVSGLPALRPGEYALIKKSNFIKLLYALWLKNMPLSYIRSEPLNPVTLKEALENAKNNVPLGFERNMEMLIRETIHAGATPVIFPFHLADQKIFALIPETWRYAEKLHPAVEYALKKNKFVLKALSKKYNVSYQEMEQNLIPLEYFFDHCHLKPEGEKIKVEFIATHLIPIIEKRSTAF